MVEEATYVLISGVWKLYIWRNLQKVSVFGEMVKKVYCAEWPGSIFLQISRKEVRLYIFY